jgi:hypothetical protein
MRSITILFFLFFFNSALAYSFDPSLLTVMKDAETALEMELAIPEPALCKKLIKKNDYKKNHRNSCQNYRALLTDYQSSILHARKKIITLNEWLPTERLFVNHTENFVFLDRPGRRIQKYNKELCFKLDLLYDSIYQYPLKP